VRWFIDMWLKKSQIQMGENIAIIFIFILLIVGALMFYAKVQKAEFSINKEEVSDKEFVQVAQKVSFIPELRCSSENVPVDNCFDALKLSKFASLVESDYLYYENDLGTSTITLEQVFPDNGMSWTLYNNPGGKSSSVPAYIPVSIFNATDGPLGSYYLGVLIVDVWRN
jgi:hypothetical protein